MSILRKIDVLRLEEGENFYIKKSLIIFKKAEDKEKLILPSSVVIRILKLKRYL